MVQVIRCWDRSCHHSDHGGGETMSEEEEIYILCVRKEDSEWTTISEGSTLTNCCECDQPVWISPASTQVMLENNAWCEKCSRRIAIQLCWTRRTPRWTTEKIILGKAVTVEDHFGMSREEGEKII